MAWWIPGVLSVESIYENDNSASSTEVTATADANSENTSSQDYIVSDVSAVSPSSEQPNVVTEVREVAPDVLMEVSLKISGDTHSTPPASQQPPRAKNMRRKKATSKPILPPNESTKSSKISKLGVRAFAVMCSMASGGASMAHTITSPMLNTSVAAWMARVFAFTGDIKSEHTLSAWPTCTGLIEWPLSNNGGK